MPISYWEPVFKVKMVEIIKLKAEADCHRRHLSIPLWALKAAV